MAPTHRLLVMQSLALTQVTHRRTLPGPCCLLQQLRLRASRCRTRSQSGWVLRVRYLLPLLPAPVLCPVLRHCSTPAQHTRFKHGRLAGGLRLQRLDVRCCHLTRGRRSWMLRLLAWLRCDPTSPPSAAPWLAHCTRRRQTRCKRLQRCVPQIPMRPHHLCRLPLSLVLPMHRAAAAQQQMMQQSLLRLLQSHRVRCWTMLSQLSSRPSTRRCART